MSSSREVTKETFTFHWNIKDVRFSTLKTGECIKSPVFSVPQFYFTTWCLRLYPKGRTEANKNFVSCFLKRGTDKGPEILRIDYNISVMPTDIRISSYHEFDKNSCWGYDEFITNTLYSDYECSLTIVLEMCFSPDRTATGVVALPSVEMVEELKYSMNCQAHRIIRNTFSYPKLCFTQTRFRSTKKILRYSMADSLLDTDGCEQLIPFIFSDEDPSLIITLNNTSELGEIEIDISRVKNKFEKSFMVDCQLSVFVNKTAFLNLFGEYIFYAEEEDDRFYLDENIDVSHLKESCKECSTNDVTFVFEFHFSTGKTTSDILWDVNFQRDSVTPKLSAVSTEMQQLYTNKELCDIILKVKDKTFEAHKVILSAMSPVFSAMFRSGLEESKTNTIDIKDMDEEVVEEMLYFMYTGTLQNSELQSIQKLFVAADKYQIISMMNECRDYLIDNMTHKNVCDILFLADTYKDLKLKDAAVEVIYFFRNYILSSNEWKNLAKHHSTLVNEVLTQMLLK